MKNLLLKFLAILLVITVNFNLFGFTISHTGTGRNNFYISIATGERGKPDRKEIISEKQPVQLISYWGELDPIDYSVNDLPLRITFSDFIIDPNDPKKRKQIDLGKILISENFFVNNETKESALKTLNDPYRINLSFGVYDDKSQMPEGINKFEKSNIGVKLSERSDSDIKYIIDHKLK